ncbi:MAG: exosortase [Bryobacterales bacterium]|nr:exosortase [Bryobacterales bacterium]
MTLPANSSSANASPRAVSRDRLIWLVWFTALILIGYGPVLQRLVKQWMDDPDMGHGFFVPLVAGYIAWLERDRWLSTPASGNWAGLALVVWGSIQLLIATLGAELFLARTALLFTIAGAILLAGGTGRLRALLFPLFLLVFMVPIPTIIYTQITFPLQLLASRAAELALTLIGVPVFREGNILELPSQRLSVVEACSGIRSLLSLTFLSLVYAYFFDRRVWMRWVLLFASIPIAIVANAFRVTMTGILSEYKREWADGFFHAAEGWVIFMLALIMLVGVHWFVSRAWRAAHEVGKPGVEG